jgi:ligand-binding sensor domain-containing protein
MRGRVNGKRLTFNKKKVRVPEFGIRNPEFEFLKPFTLGRSPLTLFPILTLSLLLSISLPLPLPAQTLSFRNYTTDDGLPSPEVYCVEQDDRGYMWLGTDNGVSRFDGYEFRNYTLKDNVIFFMHKDRKARIWMTSSTGKLYYTKGDSIHAYEYNHLIPEQKGNFWYAKEVYIDSLENLWLPLVWQGILKITANGDTSTIRSLSYSHELIYQVENQILTSRVNYSISPGNKKATLPISFHLEKTSFEVEGLDRTVFSSQAGQFPIVFKDNKNRHYLSRQGLLFEIKNNGLELKHEDFLLLSEKEVLFEEDNTVWQGGPGGLKRYSQFPPLKSVRPEYYLPQENVSDIFKDRSGGLWVTTLQSGIYYSPTLQLSIFKEFSSSPDQFITSLEIKDPQTIFFSSLKGQVYELNVIHHSFKKLPRVEIPISFLEQKLDIYNTRKISDLYWDPREEILWAAIGGSNAYFHKGHWRSAYSVQADAEYRIRYPIGIRFSIRPGSTLLWGGSQERFGAIDIKTKQVLFNSFHLFPRQRYPDSYQAFSGRVWVGCTDGLYEFRDSQLLDRTYLHPALSYRIEDIDQLPDSTLVFGTKGAGVVLWKGDSFRQLSTKEGLSSDMTEVVHVDSAGIIWLGTLNGLNRIDPRSGKIRQISIADGLPSREITQIRSQGKTIWIGTSNGLVRMQDEQTDTPFYPPILEGVYINQQAIPLTQDTLLPYLRNDLEFRFVSLNYPLKGDINYRFRLQEENPWQYTQSRSVNYPDLPPGDYRFEVQAQNKAGEWSRSSSFQVGIRLPFWQSGWFLSLSGLIVLGIIFAIYKNRIERLKKEAQFREQIFELESSALQAQMNPHFIFNAMTSIQNYIMKGEKKKAVSYLARFSRLIRSTLNHSRVPLIPMEEELETLRNYLELERMRFKEKFAYSITQDKNVNPAQIELPPMLIQPYLENSIHHAFNKLDRPGKIDLYFKKEGPYIIATIQDNGIGIEQSLKKKERPGQSRKSLGMSITSRRLNMLDKEDESEKVQIEEVKGEKEEVLGTKVTIRIKVEGRK